jgi:DNA-binding transcriptional MerR regulator
MKLSHGINRLKNWGKLMAELLLRVGELARKSGVSVRTLHHYDEIGLLSPAHHSGSGHRLYSERDVGRLQQIRSLRSLGFTLDQIADLLTRQEYDPLQVVELHLSRLREQLAAHQQLCQRLEILADSLRTRAESSVELFFQVLETLTMYENYYTPEQLETLRQRREALGEAGMQQAQQQWTELIAAVRQEMEKGTPPTDPRVLDLARQWRDLVLAFTGGDPGITQSLKRMYDDNIDQPGSVATQSGLDRAMFEYIGQAQAALQDSAE